MNTVVITGSTRGLGLEMAKCFRASGWNVVVNGVNPERLEKALKTLRKISSGGSVEGFRASVASKAEIQAMASFAKETFGNINIWINNAGVNQPMKPVWELTAEEIEAVLSTDLHGAVLGSCIAVRLMEKQPSGGFVYNMEGHGSNDVMISGLSMYGTSKRAVTYFTKALAKELQERKSKVKAGRLSPGVMITDFNEYNADLITEEKQYLKENGVEDDELDAFMMAMDQVYPAFMENAIQWMTDTYGSPLEYIEQELGVTEEDINTLRERYLE